MGKQISIAPWVGKLFKNLSALPKTGRRLRQRSTELQDIAYREMKKFFPFNPLNLRVWPAWRALIAHTPPLEWSASQVLLQCPREDLRGCYTCPALPRKKPLAPWESDLLPSPVSFQHSLDWCGDTGLGQLSTRKSTTTTTVNGPCQKEFQNGDNKSDLTH